MKLLSNSTIEASGSVGDDNWSMLERVMTSTVYSEDGWTTAATAPLVSRGRVAEAISENPWRVKDSIPADDSEVSVLTSLMELFDRFERGDEVRSESISPLTILS